MAITRGRLGATIAVSALGFCLYFAAAVAGDLAQVASALAHLHYRDLALIFGLSLLNYALRFGRWQWYLTTMGHALRPATSLLNYLAGFAFTMTPGKAGEAVRSVYLKSHGVSYKESLAALLSERLLDLLAIVLLACVAVIWYDRYRWIVLFTGVLVLLGIWWITHPTFLEALRRLSACRRFETLKWLPHKLRVLFETSRALLQFPAIYGGLLLGLVAWGAEGMGLYYSVAGMGLAVSASQAVGIYAVSILAGVLSFLPGGLGSTETVMGLLLLLSGVDPAHAVAATLLCRIATLWFAIAIGFVAIVVLELKAPRKRVTIQ